MSRKIITVDDCGDPGLKKSSSSHFIIAAVLLADRTNHEKLAAAIDGFRADLGWNELDEFKFSSTNKNTIKKLLRLVSQFDFETHAVVIDKAKIVNKPQLSPGETLYNYAIKELLLRLNLSDSVIVIDGVADKKPAIQTRTYLRQALKQHGIMNCKISFVDSRKDSIVQLADLVAGSVARSLDKTKIDSKDYIKLLKRNLKDIFEITP